MLLLLIGKLKIQQTVVVFFFWEVSLALGEGNSVKQDFC